MARIGRVFIPPDRLTARVREIGREVAGSEPADLLLVTKLKGGVPFLADLVRTLPTGVSVDFMALSRYEETGDRPGIAKLVKDLDRPLAGRHVLVVEDVVDTGLSLSFLLGFLQERDPASLKVCTLLEREEKRLVELPIAYSGFTLRDEYLVGYGLDFLGLYRNLPCLVVVDDMDGLRAQPLALVEHLRAWGLWPSAR